MEATAKPPLMRRMSRIFLKESSPFVKKPEINWKTVRNCAVASVVIGVIVILLLPAPKQSQGPFHEHAGAGSTRAQANGTDSTQEAIDQMQAGGSRNGGVPRDMSYLHGSGGGSPAGQDRNSTMILTRSGQDSSTQLPPGSRIAIRLIEKATVTNQGLPVIGIVTHDCVHDDIVAIPEGSKLFGEISFDDSSDRAKVDWRSIQLPDGRNHQLSAVGMSADGQAGVDGTIHSEALKNTVGQTLTRFIGAYAQGSMQTGVLGAGPGGSDNGWKNALAQTAQDQANGYAEKLKKEKRWIEVSPGTEFYGVLTQAFVFRDPGATYGR